MADVMAVVRKDIFDHESGELGPLTPGAGPLKWRKYVSSHPLLDHYLVEGDRIFLVTARPGGKLWLVAVYEDIRRNEQGWRAPRPNRVPIVDVTHLISKLRFHTGNGLPKDPAKLGQSLQNPRNLTRADIALLEDDLRRRKYPVLPPKMLHPEDEPEAEEGERVARTNQHWRRNQMLVQARLQKDGHACAHCGFSVVAQGLFPTRLPPMSRVVQVHHVLLAAEGRRMTKLEDLITLCPTCHAVAHAIARSLGSEVADAALLRKYYRC